MDTAETHPGPSAPRSLLAAEDVLGDLVAWRREGTRAALVTLAGIEGTTPRPLGAHMAVAEDGRFVGYFSSGCLEQAVALEAQAAIQAGENRLVRYGKGSTYIDLKLPCGSGIDLYLDQGLDAALLDRIAELRAQRRAFWLTTDIDSGDTTITLIADDAKPVSERRASTFRRAVVPCTRVLVVGGGPSLSGIAHLIAAAGFEIEITSPDDAARRDLSILGLASRGIADASALEVTHLDRWSAAIVAFHEHDWEAPVLAHLLRRPCFYIGVLGSKTAQANRLQKLAAMGFGPEALARVRGPVGLIPAAKSRATLAVSVLAELVSEAKAHGMLA